MRIGGIDGRATPSRRSPRPPASGCRVGNDRDRREYAGERARSRRNKSCASSAGSPTQTAWRMKRFQRRLAKRGERLLTRAVRKRYKLLVCATEIYFVF